MRPTHAWYTVGWMAVAHLKLCGVISESEVCCVTREPDFIAENEFMPVLLWLLCVLLRLCGFPCLLWAATQERNIFTLGRAR